MRPAQKNEKELLVFQSIALGVRRRSKPEAGAFNVKSPQNGRTLETGVQLREL